MKKKGDEKDEKNKITNENQFIQSSLQMQKIL